LHSYTTTDLYATAVKRDFPLVGFGGIPHCTGRQAGSSPSI